MSTSELPAHGLQVQDLRFAYSSKAVVLDGCSLDVPRGSVHGVLGCSGGGKTTLLRLIAGLERADGGSIRVDGQQLVGPGLHLAPEH